VQFFIGLGRRVTIMTLCVEGIWRIFKDRLPIVIYKGYSSLSPDKFERCVLSDMKINGNSVSPTRSVDLTSVSTSSPLDISCYLSLPPPVQSMHIGREASRWHIPVEATLRRLNTMLGVGWLPHQPSHAFDVVSIAVFDRAMVIVIPSHILESVQFPLPESLNSWHASHELLEAIPVVEAWETRSGVCFLDHVVIVRLYPLLDDPTLDIFVLFTRGKQVVEIVLKFRLKATLTVAFPWLSNVIAQQSTGDEGYFSTWQTRRRYLRLRVCDIYKVLEVGKCVEVFDWIFVSVEFTTLSGFNASGRAVNSQILLA